MGLSVRAARVRTPTVQLASSGRTAACAWTAWPHGIASPGSCRRAPSPSPSPSPAGCPLLEAACGGHRCDPLVIPVFSPSAEARQREMMQNGKKSEEAANYVAQMRDWLNSQPHLPKNLDDGLLLRFAHSCYYDLEKAKTAAELFFTIRASAPDLINNRDPLSPTMQKAFNITNLAQMKISGNRCLWVWQLNDPGLENYDYARDAKLFFMATDLWFLTNDHLCDADVVLMDVKDISLKFLTKFNVSIARKLSKYQQEALPIRLKQVHIVNAPPFIDKLFALMKPMLKKEITDLIHFHPPKSDSLFKYLDKEDLPKDYGGTLPAMEEEMKLVVADMQKNRKILNTHNLWTAADKKGKNKMEAATDMESFRSLAID